MTPISIFLIGKTLPPLSSVEAVFKRFPDLAPEIVYEEDALASLLLMEKTPPQLVVVDVALKGFSAFKLISYIKERYPEAEVLVVGDINRDREKLERALDLGASDCLFPPVHDRLPVRARLSALIEKVRLRAQTAPQREVPEALPFLVGTQGDLDSFFRRMQAAVPLSKPCLLIGEPGAGKKTVARAFQVLSGMGDGPCAYSYLPKKSKTELREEWTAASGAFPLERYFYFDGVDELDAGTQHLLYGLLKESNAGGREPPLIFSAKPALFEKVSQGLFRQDLFYLISNLIFIVPPLRDRRRDFPLLVEHFSRQWSHEGPSLWSLLTREAADALWAYPWPGNVRELRQMVHQCLLDHSARRHSLGIEDLPSGFLSTSAYVLKSDEEKEVLLPYRDAKDKALSRFHENYIIYLLKRAKGNISSAALEAGLDRSNFKKIIQRYAIKAEQFR